MPSEGRGLEARAVDADYEVVKQEAVVDTILRSANERDCDLLLMGGYGVGPVVEAVLGSTVDQILRKSA
jgi:nucleotide-binding universal stress UspA family protein